MSEKELAWLQMAANGFWAALTVFAIYVFYKVFCSPDESDKHLDQF